MKYHIKNSLLFLMILIAGCQMEKKTDESLPQNGAVFSLGELTSSDNFTGKVWVNIMGASDSTLHARFGNVTFEPGARTNWHAHPGGQILLITEGRGYYQALGQPARLLNKGDVVEIPRNIVHWHGAAPDSEFAHIAISLNTDDGAAVWSGPVTEEEYNNLP
jgi:quercetin dioxygenase-like cupin family protein